MSMRGRITGLLKTVLGRVVFGLGLGRVILRDHAVVVALHRIEAEGPNDTMTMPTAVFRRWCRFFSRQFRVVPVEVLVENLERGVRLRGELAITFDDGYSDFRTQAVPVMDEFGLPATVFVVSDFVGTAVTPWWDAATEIRYPFLSWSDLHEVAGNGFTIGSHGKSHTAMDECSPHEAWEELTVSKAALEENLHRPVALYAYPYGAPDRMPDSARTLVREAGYRACLGYGGLVNAETDPFSLPRICINNWFATPAQFAGQLVLLRLRQLLHR